MEAMGENDVDWRSGRAAVYVFHAGEDVLRVAKEAYALYQSENGLGPAAFPSLARMEGEVIDMGLDLLHAPDGACGNLTSGGTESILMAVKTCRDQAAARGIDPVGARVVVPWSAHLAFDKAARYLGLEIVRVPLAADLRADVDAMAAAVDLPVTVKCRLGVDDADSDPLLDSFVDRVADAGCRTLYIHARKAWLHGLSPAQNRDLPPLQYERVYRQKARRPELEVIINGGLRDADAAVAQLDRVDGVMLGRAAYQHPLLVGELDATLFQSTTRDATSVMAAYLDYIEEQLGAGTRLHDMTRHVLGLFHGVPGARRFRQILSNAQRLRANDADLVREALATLQLRAA